MSNDTPLSHREAAEEQATTEEFIQINKQRAATYGLLARLFRVEIDEDLLNELRSMRFPANAGNDEMTQGYRLIATYLSNTWENTLTELAIDYTRVFIGHGIDAYSAAYPYESVYTSEKRLLMQDARDEVLSIYRSEGLDKQDSWKEGEDHIALELEFEQWLCDRIVDALGRDNPDEAVRLLTTQKNFLVDHLAAWAPMMTSDMKRFAKTDLYRGLAYLTEGYLRMDRAFLKEILAEDENEDTNDSNANTDAGEDADKSNANTDAGEDAEEEAE